MTYLVIWAILTACLTVYIVLIKGVKSVEIIEYTDVPTATSIIFQFLIGNLKTVVLPDYLAKMIQFQFLIGNLKTEVTGSELFPLVNFNSS